MPGAVFSNAYDTQFHPSLTPTRRRGGWRPFRATDATQKWIKGLPVECFPAPARETKQTARTRFPAEAPVRGRRDTRPRVLRASAALVQVTALPGGACPGSFPNTSYTSPLEYAGLVFSVALSIQHIFPLNSLLRPSQKVKNSADKQLTSPRLAMHMHYTSGCPANVGSLCNQIFKILSNIEMSLLYKIFATVRDNSIFKKSGFVLC